MKRFKILFGQRRFQVLATMAAVLVAVSVVVASGASFTAKSANASNVFSSGTLSMSDTPTGMSVTVADMVPGDTHSGTVTIQNTGTVQGHFYLEPVALAGNTLGYADQIQLVITDGATEVYNGALSGLAQEDLGTWAANESHTYAFKVSFPDQGRDTAGDGVDNAFMGATATAEFDWTTVSVERGAL